MKAFLAKVSKNLKIDLMKGRRERLTLEQMPTRIYAVGDVHGCYDQMVRLEERIIAESDQDDAIKFVIYLGDLVDRGINSSNVVEHCLKPLPERFVRICLCGNHDQAFVDFYYKPSLKSEWLDFGGRETLSSYGIDVDYLQRIKFGKQEFEAMVKRSIPPRHIAFLESLPVALTTPMMHFVHAGMRPDIPMEHQTDEDLMWIRQDFLTDEWASDRLVIHGHTPAREPMVGPGRIGIDTAAYSKGPLTAIRIVDEDYSFMQVEQANGLPRATSY